MAIPHPQLPHWFSDIQEIRKIILRKYLTYIPTFNMNNGKQGEQLLKVLGGHSASLDRTSKMQRAK